MALPRYNVIGANWRKPSLLRGLHNQSFVIKALLLREFKGRFGSFNTGYLWLFGEPLTMVVAITLIFSIRGRNIVGDIDLPVFVLTGIVPFLAFRGIVGHVAGAVLNSRALLNYRQVRPIDAMLAIFILEMLLFFVVFGVFCLLAIWIGYRIEFSEPLRFLYAMICLFLFSFGVACISSVLAHYSEEFLKFQRMVMRALFFLSGTFFTVDMMPEFVRPYMLWNPILHAVEIVREGFYTGHHVSYGDPAYLATCTVIALAAGLLVTHTFRRAYYVNR